MAVEDVRERIEQELSGVVERLRQLGGALVVEEPAEAGTPDDPAVEAVGSDLEAHRGLLVERANRLAEALDRLRLGQYGVCEECGETIAPARLRVMPEATTCVACQERRERSTRRLAPQRFLPS